MKRPLRQLVMMILVLASLLPTVTTANAASPNPVPLLPDLIFKLTTIRGVPVLQVVNQGAATAPQFTVTVQTYNPYATAKIYYSKVIRPLVAGKSYTVGAVTDFQLPGSPCFEAHADVAQTVIETNESNNKMIGSGPEFLPCFVTPPGQ